MRANTRRLLVALAVIALGAYFVNANVVGVVRYVNKEGAFRWRDGSVVQDRLLVLGMVDIADDEFEPPSTNSANGYCGKGDARSINPDTPTAIGYDDLSFKPMLLSNGMVLGILESPGRMPHKACFRGFSAKHVVDAAYYADGAAITIQAMPDRPQNEMGTWTISTINPAYRKLMFDDFPQRLDMPAATNQPASVLVTGSINTCPGGANNMLDNNLVMVYWRTNTVDLWKPLGGYQIRGNGDFSGACPEVTEVMVGMAIDPGALPNSLLGQGPFPLPRKDTPAK